jgi:multisubunit Na+/H+ antiporter MnhB subunit
VGPVGSMGGAGLSVAFVVADTQYGVDTSANFRLNSPTVHGYMPKNTRHALLVSLGTFLFAGGMVTSKWVAIATLATTSATAVGSWLVAELVVLFVLRYAVEGSWRFQDHGADAAVPSVLIHVGLYLGSVAAPFPLFRYPGFLGPSLYSASACYQTIVSPLMLGLAFRLDEDDRLPQTELWSLLGGATVTVLLGAGLMGCYMVPEFRKTFYEVSRTRSKFHPQRH